MIALITSCGRPDLLDRTIKSLKKNQQFEIKILINEDAVDVEKSRECLNVAEKNECLVIVTPGIGQHSAIESFLSPKLDSKYYLHLEDDWLFDNSYDWIQASIDIMENNPKIIKVLCREDYIHPVECFENLIVSINAVGIPPRTKQKNGPMYGFLQPWADPWHNTLWHGFSWNPGVTRLDLLKEFIPFSKWEQDVSKDVYEAGYRTVILEKGVCKHIGDGRSTHQ